MSTFAIQIPKPDVNIRNIAAKKWHP